MEVTATHFVKVFKYYPPGLRGFNDEKGSYCDRIVYELANGTYKMVNEKSNGFTDITRKRFEELSENYGTQKS